jgi:glycerate kinase
MRIVIAPDKFKGTLSALEAGEAIAAGLKGHDVHVHPVADGGEGTVQVIAAAMGALPVTIEVSDPLGRPVQAEFALAGDLSGGGGTALMEMSSASGLGLLAEEERDPWRASSRGSGELLVAARDAGVDSVIIGIGGSATNDGGAGLSQALGVQYLDDGGLEIDDIPERLTDAAQIFQDISLDLPAVTVACDVNNPLLGDNGATRIYSAQKGVAEEEMSRHELRMEHLANLVTGELGIDYRDVPGAGAAGGLGFGLMSFCDARLRPGFELVAEMTGLAGAMKQADLVITGEGSIDAQSLMGKAPAGVASMARKAGKPVIAFCGRLSDAENLSGVFDAILPVVDEQTTIEMAMGNPAISLKNKVARCRMMIEKWGQ